ncbi:MAG TPA: hypothetical protein VGM03_18325 [Phycisphaerae bacterium]|jgi:hypothetical protein
MSSNGRPVNGAPVGEIRSLSVLLGRLMWIAFGPIALVLISLGIVTRGTGWLTALDLAFGVVVALMLLGRWAEHRSGVATRASGEPATDEDFRRYVRVFSAVALGIWVAANVLGNHLLRGQ